MRIGSQLPLLIILIAPPAFAVDFKKDVEPILRTNCYKCHGRDEKGELRMDDLERFAARIGEGTFRDDDIVIVPGKPEESEVIIKVTRPYEHEDRMPPPRRGEPLTGAQIATLKAWIKEGASFEEGASTPPPSEPAMPDKNAIQIWTSSGGQTMKAYFVKVDGANVVLKSEAGVEKPFPISIFSDESKELIAKMAKAE